MKVRLKRHPGGRHKVATAIVAALAVAVLAGCGGGSDEGDVARDDFIADADAICARYTTDSDSLESEFDQALKDEDLASAADDFRKQAVEVTAMLDQLAGLDPPSADQTLMEQLVALGRQRVDLAGDAADAIAAGDKDAMIAAGKEGSALAGEYFQLADNIGFKACGSGSGSAGDRDSAEG